MTPCTVDHKAPLSMGFPTQEHWSGLPFTSARHLPNPGIEHTSPILQVDSLLSEIQGNPLTNGQTVDNTHYPLIDNSLSINILWKDNFVGENSEDLFWM